MKVIFNCNCHEFHRDYYKNIATELVHRKHQIEFAYDYNIREADFTITADEAQTSLGGKCVWIGHSFDAKGAMWNDTYYLKHLQENTDYAFVYSDEYKRILEKYYTKPIYVSGMAKLDGLFNIKQKKSCILYAPTFNPELSANRVIVDIIGESSEFGRVLYRQHPAFIRNPVSLENCFKRATMVISDYSSVGMESIVLNIPTILVNSPDKHTYKSFPNNNYICNRARKAAIGVGDVIGLKNAIQKYLDRPTYLEDYRLEYGNKLCEYQNVASKRTVDLLETILKEDKNEKPSRKIN